jgi:F-type H+-transporting ATPase subunit gamma
MPASLRETRNRIRSVTSTAKITRAMELIAASRVMRAQANARAATPYASELTRAVSALASQHQVDHPLTTEAPSATRAAVLVITSDRGQAGAYSASVIKEAQQLTELLSGQGKQVIPYLSGRKGVDYYRFREREYAESWVGFSDQPKYSDARTICEELLEAFTADEDERVHEIHVVFTRFHSMIRQTPEVLRLLPLEVVDAEDADEDVAGGEQPADEVERANAGGGAHELTALYDFEPSPEEVLDALLPRYIASRIHFALLQAAASELAARQRAMKSATDNANDMIERLTRDLNQARQAQITQEISEIVGGASALADSSSEGD